MLGIQKRRRFYPPQFKYYITKNICFPIHSPKQTLPLPIPKPIKSQISLVSKLLSCIRCLNSQNGKGGESSTYKKKKKKKKKKNHKMLDSTTKCLTDFVPNTTRLPLHDL